MLPTPEDAQPIRAHATRSPDLRVSDADRERYIAVLRTQCAAGRLSLDEFSDRAERVYGAPRQVDLDAVVADLPVPWHSAVRAHTTVATVRDKIRGRRWHVALFGETARKGRYRLTGDTAAVAIFGECTLDLTRAEVTDAETRIDAVAVFGEVTVIVPPGIDVTLEGVAVFGEKRLHGDADPVPGAPTLTVRALATFGAVRVLRT
jgi:hypothetical protein